MAFGLEKGPGQTKIRGFAGGALRLITMLFVLSPMLIKPIRAAASKVFGETTEYKKEKEEAKAKKAEKEQQKELKKVQKQNPQATIPMSEQELTQKLMENPEVLQKLQNDPELLQQVSNNPQMLMDMLAQNAQAQQQAQIPNNANNTVSPALRQRMNMAPQSAQIPNYTNNVQNYNVFNYPLNNNAPQSAPALQKHSNSQPAAEPKRKYVPSSKPAQVSASEITAEQKANIDRALIKADEAEASATSVL